MRSQLFFGVLAIAFAFVSLKAQAFSFPVNLDSLKPFGGSESILVHYTNSQGTKYEFLDDDGMATLVSLNYMLTWERKELIREKTWSLIKSQNAPHYQEVRPLYVQQLKRLSANYKAWAQKETDSEAQATYEQFAQKTDHWLAVFSDEATVTNEELQNFTSDINDLAKYHSYPMSTDEGEFVASQKIYGPNGQGGSNEISEHNSAIDSRCSSETTGDIAALVKGALAGKSLDDVLKAKGTK